MANCLRHLHGSNETNCSYKGMDNYEALRIRSRQEIRLSSSSHTVHLKSFFRSKQSTGESQQSSELLPSANEPICNESGELLHVRAGGLCSDAGGGKFCHVSHQTYWQGREMRKEF